MQTIEVDLVCGSGGNNFVLDGIGNVYGEGRILDNGVNNNPAFTVWRHRTFKIFVGQSNRDDVQLGNKSICHSVYSDVIGKYFDGAGRQCERNGDFKRF